MTQSLTTPGPERDNRQLRIHPHSAFLANLFRDYWPITFTGLHLYVTYMSPPLWYDCSIIKKSYK